MPTIPQRIATAFAVLSGRYGDDTKMAQDRERSRQSLYREADEVIEAVDGAAVEARIDELRRELAEQRAEVRALRERLKLAVEITPEKHHEFAAVAQAEGGQPERGPAALARRGRIEGPSQRGDAGACDPGGRRAGRPPAPGP